MYIITVCVPVLPQSVPRSVHIVVLILVHNDYVVLLINVYVQVHVVPSACVDSNLHVNNKNNSLGEQIIELTVWKHKLHAIQKHYKKHYKNTTKTLQLSHAIQY